MNDSPISSLSFDFDLGSMSFSSLFKKASNLLGIGSPSKPPPLDGEVRAFLCIFTPYVVRPASPAVILLY